MVIIIMMIIIITVESNLAKDRIAVFLVIVSATNVFVGRVRWGGMFDPAAGAFRSCAVHTSNNVEAILSNATNQTILSTESNVASTLLPFWQRCRTSLS